MRRLILSVFSSVFLACGTFAAVPVELHIPPEGHLIFPGGKLSVAAYCPGWKTASVRLDYASFKSTDKDSAETIVRPFKVWGRGNELLFSGSYEWVVKSKRQLKGKVRVECAAECTMQCLTLSAQIPDTPAAVLGRKTLSSYQLPVDGNRPLLLTFPSATPSHSQDSRKWGGKWTYRFGKTLEGGTFAKGDVVEWNFTLSAPDGNVFKVVPSRTLTIERGENWTYLEHKKDVLKGSALDFSNMRLQDAPAGKYGWLKAVGGHFEFEKLPGVEQRFYGVNLCFGANYLTHEDADLVVERLVRCGYNSIRIHHHDGAWFESDENKEKLDYLIARAIEKGLYVTTDLYVSRKVKWRTVGLDRDGDASMSLYKAHIGVNDLAFNDWAFHAKSFLEHVNPYTGRAYKDEPAMPLIALVNEGRLVIAWDQEKKWQDPFVVAAWKEFGGKGPLPRPDWSDYHDPFNRFDEWVNARVWKKGSSFVRSLGCGALLSNDNDGRWHSEGEGLTPLYDYVDNHFYIDLPKFLEKSWSLPSYCANENPIRKGEPEIFSRGWAKKASKPYTITEWNFAGPGRFRAMGGILTGALASEHEWDGLWRFAYSHSNRNLKDDGGRPGYFDCVTDPLIAASDRASVCLYLRRDAAEGALRTDAKSGSMSFASKRTCGGFTEGGRINAGNLSFDVKAKSQRPVPTTLWISSLDGKPIEKSSRMLLVHLTDVQGEGTCYADARRKVVLKWGKGCLVENGIADVSLKIDSPGKHRVYELDSSGKRGVMIATSIKGGELCFQVSSSGLSGGRIYYEILRSK